MACFTLPQNMSLTEAIHLCNRVWEAPEAAKYEFDFQRMGRVEPFTMAYVANEMKRFRKSNEGTPFTALNFQHHTYPSHMGFFKALGLNHGNAPGHASGCSTDIPPTLLNVADIEEGAARRALNPGDILEKKASRIAHLLIRQCEGTTIEVDLKNELRLIEAELVCFAPNLTKVHDPLAAL